MVLGNTTSKEDDAVTVLEEFAASADILTKCLERLDTELTEANNRIEELEKELEAVQDQLKEANARLSDNDLEEIN